MSLTRGTLGYRYDLERPAWLEQNGHDPRVMLKAAETLPAFNPFSNPLDVIEIRNQLKVSACAGFSGALVKAICYWRHTGRTEVFSALGCYILAQRLDGIRGDNGATLSGVQRVLTQHGLCLDSEWPFRGRYDAREPNPKPRYLYRLKNSKPIKDVGLAFEWLQAGLPIHWGISWGREMDREVVDSFTGRGGGGHAIVTWLLKDNDTAICENSWGERWNGDGCHVWTRKAIGQMLKHKWTVAIGYGPEQMELPPLEPVA